MMLRRLMPKAIHILLAVAGFTAGVASALLATSDDAHAVYYAYVTRGYAQKCYYWGPGQGPGQFDPFYGGWYQGHPCWHYDESSWPSYGGLDLSEGNGNDGNQAVYWNHYSSSWGGALFVTFITPIPGSSCTVGVRAVLPSPLAGTFHYKQVNATSGLNNTSWQNWYEYPGSVTGTRYLGTTRTGEPTSCSDGPHLHQSGDVDWWTDIYRNFPSIEPTGPGLRYWWTGYVHYVQIP